MFQDLNFRPSNTLLKDGYSVSIEIGDLEQSGTVYQDQCLRVTTVSPSGDTEWEIFRGSEAGLKAGKWLATNTNGIVTSIIPF